MMCVPTAEKYGREVLYTHLEQLCEGLPLQGVMDMSLKVCVA